LHSFSLFDLRPPSQTKEASNTFVAQGAEMMQQKMRPYFCIHQKLYSFQTKPSYMGQQL